MFSLTIYGHEMSRVVDSKSVEARNSAQSSSITFNVTYQAAGACLLFHRQRVPAAEASAILDGTSRGDPPVVPALPAN